MSAFPQVMRLIWIDAMLEPGRPLRRWQICDAFGISAPQASLDLAQFSENWPTRMVYCGSRKGYFTHRRGPVFGSAAHQAVRSAAHHVRTAHGRLYLDREPARSAARPTGRPRPCAEPQPGGRGS